MIQCFHKHQCIFERSNMSSLSNILMSVPGYGTSCVSVIASGCYVCCFQSHEFSGTLLWSIMRQAYAREKDKHWPTCSPTTESVFEGLPSPIYMSPCLANIYVECIHFKLFRIPRVSLDADQS